MTRKKLLLSPRHLVATSPRCHGWLLAVLCFLVIAGNSPCSAQSQGPDGVWYSRKGSFSIPFHPEGGADRRIKQVQLHVSEDRGRTWKQVAVAQPDDKSFTYHAKGDGHYYFKVRTVDMSGRMFPQDLNQGQPDLKVCVDTVPPTVVLRSLPAQGNAVSVQWDIRDDNLLDLDSLVLDYRTLEPAGNRDWIPVRLEHRAASSHQAWTPAFNEAIEVRLQVKDRAGNLAEKTTTVSPSGTVPPRAAGDPPTPDRSPPSSTANADVSLVNSKTIKIHYDITSVGKSGVSVVELWYTRDGRKWQKHKEVSKPESPYIFEAPEEGLYGFTIVARSGVGLGEPPPRDGDLPQIWVEVDTIKPVVRLLKTEVGTGEEKGNLTITWTTSEKKYPRKPITLSYAVNADGPWTSIASSLENTGRYVWRMPGSVPYQFYVRIEATDRAGNVGSADTQKPVAVDLSVPRATGLKVGPAAKP